MIVDNNIKENFINNNTNIDNNNQEKFSTEKTSAASNSLNQIDIIFNQNSNNINDNSNYELNNKNNENDIQIENKIDHPKDDFDNDIIEDNIKKIDTINILNQKKIIQKPDEKVYYEGDEDLNSQIIAKNRKSKNNFKYHVKINKEVLKYTTLITIIIYIILTIISCIVFHMRREENPFLFCFKFLDRVPQQYLDKASKEIIYFLTDLNSFYIIHLVLFTIFISVCYLLIKGNESDIDYFFKDMSIFFFSTLIFNIPILFSGMFTNFFYGNHLQPISYLILTLLGFLCMVKIFIVAKRHKYKKISSLINISILSSFMTAYQCYCFIFCVAYSYMNFFKPTKDNGKEYPEVEIIAGCIYFAIGIMVMTVFKDIFFIIAMINIEIGLLYTKKSNKFSIIITIFNISIVSLNFASIIIIIFAYNKKIFRLKDKK